jgi:hypothetical protein
MPRIKTARRSRALQSSSSAPSTPSGSPKTTRRRRWGRRKRQAHALTPCVRGSPSPLAPLPSAGARHSHPAPFRSICPLQWASRMAADQSKGWTFFARGFEIDMALYNDVVRGVGARAKGRARGARRGCRRPVPRARGAGGRAPAAGTLDPFQPHRCPNRGPAPWPFALLALHQANRIALCIVSMGGGCKTLIDLGVDVLQRMVRLALAWRAPPRRLESPDASGSHCNPRRCLPLLPLPNSPLQPAVH